MKKVQSFIAKYLKPWGLHHAIVVVLMFWPLQYVLGVITVWGLTVGWYAGKEYAEARTRILLEQPAANYLAVFKSKRWWEIPDFVAPFIAVTIWRIYLTAQTVGG